VYTVQLRGQPRADPLVLSTATCVWGLAFLLPWQLWEVATGRAGFDMRVSLLVAVTYLGVIASAGTLVLWTYGAARLAARTNG
jgi:drug/metabolite transporter (DMT)-like permease